MPVNSWGSALKVGGVGFGFVFVILILLYLALWLSGQLGARQSRVQVKANDKKVAAQVEQKRVPASGG